MTGDGSGKWLPPVFWTIACVEFSFCLYLAIQPATGEFGGLAAMLFAVLAGAAAVLMLIFALIRNGVARGILLALLVAPLLLSPFGWPIVFVGVPLLIWGVRLLAHPATGPAADIGKASETPETNAPTSRREGSPGPG